MWDKTKINTERKTMNTARGVYRVSIFTQYIRLRRVYYINVHDSMLIARLSCCDRAIWGGNPFASDDWTALVISQPYANQKQCINYTEHPLSNVFYAFYFSASFKLII